MASIDAMTSDRMAKMGFCRLQGPEAKISRDSRGLESDILREGYPLITNAKMIVLNVTVDNS